LLTCFETTPVKVYIL